jgi:hypothetical protein
MLHLQLMKRMMKVTIKIAAQVTRVISVVLGITIVVLAEKPPYLTTIVLQVQTVPEHDLEVR